MGLELRNAAWMARCVGRGDLAPFGPEAIAELASAVGVRRIEAGTPLMSEGEAVSRIGIIQDGEVELYRRHAMRRVVLQVLRPGDVYGDIPFLCHMPPPFGARALTVGGVIELDAEGFWRLLETRPGACQRFLFSVASRLQRMQLRLLELTSGDLRHQVASLLLDETGGGSGAVHLTQATIAQLLGASRPSVNRVLKDLEADGFVALTYRRVEVVDPAGLDAVAR